MYTENIYSNLEFNEARPVIQVLIDTDFSKEIRIAMHKNTVMKEHKTQFPIVVHIIEGQIAFGVEGKTLELKPGDLIALAPHIPHDLKAHENSIIRLTLNKNDSVQRVQKIAESSQNIRKATPQDADSVAPLMFQAMEDIVYKLIGKEDAHEAISFLKNLFTQTDNQYSYQNTFVYEEDGQVIGSLVFYNGKNLQKLRQPVLEYAQKYSKTSIAIEDETSEGETYLDTLSISPQHQGKGIGLKLLNFLVKYTQENALPPATLLVDENNPKAEALYLRAGFVFKNTQNLAGGKYKRLVYQK